MSRLEELIEQYCPDGVEWKALYSITKQFSGMTGVSNKWAEEGNCVFIDYNNVYNHASVDTTALKNATVKSLKQNTLRKGDVLFTSASETPDECALSSVIEKDLPDGVFLDDHLFGLRLLDEYSSVISPSYLKYAFRSEQFRFQIKKVVRGATRHYVSKVDFMKLEIPVPPIPVQEEIVRILDNFTELQAELQAELQKRKEQHKYYREGLLTSFVSTKIINKYKLGDICELGTGSHNTQDGLKEGAFPFYTRGVDILGLSTYDFDETAIITAGDGVGVGKVFHYVKGKYALHQRAYRIVPNQKIVLPRYLYYYFETEFYAYIMRSSVSSSVTSIRKPMLLGFPVILPSLSDQQKIVDILDRFDTLTTDLTQGLPAEIEKRTEQNSMNITEINS